MANHKSAIKRNRQNITRAGRNSAKKAAVRTTIKKVLSAVKDGNLKEAKTLALEAESVIASAAKKGLYHPRNAQRKISRLMKAVNKVEKK